jgi:hypothetical protein
MAEPAGTAWNKAGCSGKVVSVMINKNGAVAVRIDLAGGCSGSYTKAGSSITGIGVSAVVTVVAVAFLCAAGVRKAAAAAVEVEITNLTCN